MSAYYNEHDPFAAAWLRELIADGLIAPGEVDERDIQDVRPDELRSFRQWHLFAGIGIWSGALRSAGWGDEREVLTVSCPCQPFSAAGEGKGFADERHLWPAAFHIIGELGPSIVFGEQVASPDGHAWLDLVSADMEAASYTGAAFDLCSAGFGAPNIRQRLYFVWLAHAGRSERGPHPERRVNVTNRANAGREEAASGFAVDRPASRLADTDGRHASAEGLQRGGQHGQRAQDAGDRASCLPGPVNGFWRDADWILCRDPDGPTWRPVEPTSFPLASGHTNRLGILRGSGNALNKEVAQGFIEEVMALIAAEAEKAAA